MASLASLRSFIVLAFALLLTVPAAGGGFLDSGKPDPQAETKTQAPEYAAPAARRPVEGDDSSAWEAQLYNAKLRVEEATQNHDAAAYALTRARTRRYPRGDALEALKTQAGDLLRERGEAESDFSKTLEEARRAGTPAGVLAEYMDFDDEIKRSKAAAAQQR